MFYGCPLLKEISFFKFQNEKVISMSNVFNECISLKKLMFFEFITTKCS